MSVKTVAMQSYCMPGVYHPQASLNQTRFGSVGTAMATVFQPISENFVWEFLSQDVVALWIPRIITSLRRGRHPYDPYEDPQLREGKPLQQWFHSIYMNAKGLNWSNAREESYREFETGPGIFIAPSIVFGLFTSALLGHKALQMNNKSLHSYAKGLSDWKEGQSITAEERPRQFFKHILEKSHLQPQLQDHFAVPTPKGTTHMHYGVKQLVGNVLGKTGETTGKDALNAWAKLVLDQGNRHHIDTLLKFEKDHNSGFAHKIGLHQLGFHSGEHEKMSHLLKRMMMAYHDVKVQDAIDVWTDAWHKSYSGGFTQYFKRVKQHNELQHGLHQMIYWANRSKNVDPEYVKLAFEESASTSHQVFDNMHTFRGFIQKLSSQGALKNWASDINHLLKCTTVHKFGLSILATAAACWTVVAVSAKAQKGRAYPANRNVQMTDMGKTPSPSSDFTQPNYTGPTDPTPQWLPIETTSNPWASTTYNPWTSWQSPYNATPAQTVPWMTGGLA